jgi:hypothetical protein
MRWLHQWLAALAVAALTAAPAIPAELIMFYRDGCPYCATWEREIGTIYDKTEFSRRAPLRRIDLDRAPAQVVLRSAVIYTPTFVLADADWEVARIEGYPGHEFFWGMLERLLQLIPARRTQERSVSTPDLAAALRFDLRHTEETIQ